MRSYAQSLFHVGPPTFCPICGEQLYWRRRRLWDEYNVHILKMHPEFAAIERRIRIYPAIVGVVLLVFALMLVLIPALKSLLSNDIVGITLASGFVLGIIMLPIVPRLIRRRSILRFRLLWNEQHLTATNP